MQEKRLEQMREELRGLKTQHETKITSLISEARQHESRKTINLEKIPVLEFIYFNTFHRYPPQNEHIRLLKIFLGGEKSEKLLKEIRGAKALQADCNQELVKGNFTSAPLLEKYKNLVELIEQNKVELEKFKAFLEKKNQDIKSLLELRYNIQDLEEQIERHVEQISQDISESKTSANPQDPTELGKREVDDLLSIYESFHDEIEKQSKRNKAVESQIERLSGKLDAIDEQSRENIEKFSDQAELTRQQIQILEEKERAKSRSRIDLNRRSKRALESKYKVVDGLIAGLKAKIKDLPLTDKQNYEKLINALNIEIELLEKDIANKKNLSSKKLDAIISRLDKFDAAISDIKAGKIKYPNPQQDEKYQAESVSSTSSGLGQAASLGSEPFTMHEKVDNSPNGNNTTSAAKPEEKMKALELNQDPLILDDKFEIILGSQAGSNGGCRYIHKETGKEYHVKFLQDDDHASNEVLAAKLYELAGVKVPKVSLIKRADGRLGVASEIVQGFKSAQNPAAYKDKNLPGVYEGFAVDAWLANWDVVGLECDNLGSYINPETGKEEACRIDTGGALIYRAQGSPKGDWFTDGVGEIDSLLRKDLNPQAASIFAGISDDKIKHGVQLIANIDDKAITETIMKFGPGTEEQKTELVRKMLARKANLMKRFKVQAQNSEKILQDSSNHEQVLEFDESSAEKYEGLVLSNIPLKKSEKPLGNQGVNTALQEQAIEVPSGKRASAGVIIVEDDGRVWIYEPKNHFGGYHHTFPKGRPDETESLQQAAIREAFEETGLSVEILGQLGDYERSTTMTRYYVAKRTGGAPWAFQGTSYQSGSQETAKVRLVPARQLESYVDKNEKYVREFDQKVVEDLLNLRQEALKGSGASLTENLRSALSKKNLTLPNSAYQAESVSSTSAISEPTSASIPSSSQSATLEDFDLDDLLPYQSTQKNDKEIKNGSEKQSESVIIDENVGNDPKVSSTTSANISEVRMKTAAEIFDEAKQSPRVVGTSFAILAGGSYNTRFLLDGSQIHAQALISLSQKLGISLNEAARNLHVYDFQALPSQATSGLDYDTFSEELKTEIQEARLKALSGKPFFFTFSNGRHFVLVSLIRDKNNPHKIHVVYNNSMLVKDYKGNELTATGQHFAQVLVNALNEIQEGTTGSNFIDASIDQQYDDCCGLSVAENIASIAKHCEDGGATDADSIKRSLRSFPRGDAEKQPFYQRQGKELFEALDNPNIAFEAPYSPPAPQRPAGARNANRNGGGDAPANSQEGPQSQPNSGWGKTKANPQAEKKAQNDPEGEGKEANNPEAKKDDKKDEKNEAVSPKNHDKEKDSISWKALGWLTAGYLFVGALFNPLTPAIVAAVAINALAAAAKFVIGVIDAVKSLIEAIASLIKGILDSVRALLQLFGKGIDYVVTKVTGKEKLIDDVPLEEQPRREPNQPEHGNPRNPAQPRGPENDEANQRPQSQPGLAAPVPPATTSGTVPAPQQQQTQAPNTAQVSTRAPIIKDFPTESERNAANQASQNQQPTGTEPKATQAPTSGAVPPAPPPGAKPAASQDPATPPASPRSGSVPTGQSPTSFTR